MKPNLKMFFIFLATALSFLSSAKAEKPITLKEVVEKVSTQNYLVRENAEAVYQTRQSVQLARRDLLPKLNVWQIAELAFTGGMGAIGMIEDIAPFLIPSNWFRVEENKLLLKVQKEGYRSLWANEVWGAKATYLNILNDQELLSVVNQNINDFHRILRIVRAREELGAAPIGQSRDLEIKLLSLEEDKRSLQVILSEESNLLSYVMGLNGVEKVAPVPIELPDFDKAERLKYSDYEAEVLAASPELKQFDAIIEAAKYVKKEIQLSFLGGSSMSRGVAGGVFDNIPTPNGLGFGQGPALRIQKSSVRVYEIQKQGVAETLKRQLSLLVDTYNLDLENYRNCVRRLKLAVTSFKTYYERIEIGAEVETDQLVEASRNIIEASMVYADLRYRLLRSDDKLKRLLFLGDYSNSPNPFGNATKNESNASSVLRGVGAL